jgi:hypothetical protein
LLLVPSKINKKDGTVQDVVLSLFATKKGKNRQRKRERGRETEKDVVLRGTVTV